MDSEDERLVNVLKEMLSRMRRQPGDEHADCKGYSLQKALLGREMILKTIDIEERITQKKLAESLLIRPQSLSELLGKLERDGFISRTQNETDKREIFVSLTETGRERAKEVEEERREELSRFFGVLTREEKDTLCRLLEKLIMQSGD